MGEGDRRHLVIGSGAAGLTAALVAATEGARTLLCEKTDLIGGTSARSGGTLWIPASDQTTGPAWRTRRSWITLLAQ